MRLVKLVVLALVVRLVSALTWSIHLGSIGDKGFTLSVSLFGVFILLSEATGVFRTPLVNNLVNTDVTTKRSSLSSVQLIVFSSATNALLNVLYVPAFLEVFSGTISGLRIANSIPSVMTRSLGVGAVGQVIGDEADPGEGVLSDLECGRVPGQFLLLGAVVATVCAVNMVSTCCTTSFMPRRRHLTTSTSSNVVGNITAVLLALLISPRSTVVASRTLERGQPCKSIGTLIVLLVNAGLLNALVTRVFMLPTTGVVTDFCD